MGLFDGLHQAFLQETLSLLYVFLKLTAFTPNVICILPFPPSSSVDFLPIEERIPRLENCAIDSCDMSHILFALGANSSKGHDLVVFTTM